MQQAHMADLTSLVLACLLLLHVVCVYAPTGCQGARLDHSEEEQVCHTKQEGVVGEPH